MSPCFGLIICPVCGASLGQVGRSLKCPQAHSFDLAREGYVNLLLASPKHQRRGDTATMLDARRQFLNGGYYQPLSEAVNDLITNFLGTTATLTPNQAAVIVEAGSGEGYYLGRLQAALA